jgi:hypothetical protein
MTGREEPSAKADEELRERKRELKNYTVDEEYPQVPYQQKW